MFNPNNTSDANASLHHNDNPKPLVQLNANFRMHMFTCTWLANECFINNNQFLYPPLEDADAIRMVVYACEYSHRKEGLTCRLAYQLTNRQFNDFLEGMVHILLVNMKHQLGDHLGVSFRFKNNPFPFLQENHTKVIG